MTFKNGCKYLKENEYMRLKLWSHFDIKLSILLSKDLLINLLWISASFENSWNYDEKLNLISPSNPNYKRLSSLAIQSLSDEFHLIGKRSKQNIILLFQSLFHLCCLHYYFVLLTDITSIYHTYQDYASRYCSVSRKDIKLLLFKFNLFYDKPMLVKKIIMVLTPG